MLCFKASLPEKFKDGVVVRPSIRNGLYWLDKDEDPLRGLEQHLIRDGYMKIQCEDPEEFAYRKVIAGFTDQNELDDDINHFSNLLYTYKYITFTYGYGDDSEDTDANGRHVESVLTEKAHPLILYLPTRGCL